MEDSELKKLEEQVRAFIDRCARIKEKLKVEEDFKDKEIKIT